MLRHTFPQPVIPQRAFVIGAEGFIGSAVTALLRRSAVSVCQITRREVDLLDAHAASRIGALIRPGDVVVAAAGITPCKDATSHHDNLKLSLTLAKIAAHAGIAHFVNIGSDAVYGDLQMPLTESSGTIPTTLYGSMHVIRENLIREHANVPAAFLRLTAVYGAADRHNTYGPNRFRRNAQNDQPIVLFGGGEELRDYVYIDDVARIVQLVLYRRSFGILNVATGAVTSFRDIAKMIRRAALKAISIEETARVAPMPYNGYRAFDTAAMRLAFPDFSHTPLREGLAFAQHNEFPDTARSRARVRGEFSN